MSDRGQNPVVVAITGGPPRGTARVEVGDERREIDLDRDGTAEVTIDLDPGDHEIEVFVENAEGVVAIDGTLARAVVDDGDGGSVARGLTLVALLGLAGWWWLRRRRRPAVQTPDPPPPPGAA